MKKLLASLGLLAIAAMPVNAQDYRMSVSEETLADAYGTLGSSTGFLICDAYRIGITDPQKILSNMYSRLTQGDAEMLDAIVDMPEDNYYRRRYTYNLTYQMEVSGCYDRFVKSIK